MSDSTTSQKHCKKCNRDLPATSEFWHTRRASPDGLAYICKECAIAKTRQWVQGDPDRARKLARESQQKHKAERSVYRKERAEHYRELKQTPEYKAKEASRRQRKAVELREYNRQYRAEHPEVYSNATAEWRKRNPEKTKALMHQRIAARRGAPGSYTADDVKRMYDDQAGHCGYCGVGIFMDIPKDVHVDHVIPLSRGGSNGAENVLLTCQLCNQSKGSKTVSEWKVTRGW